MKFDVFFDVFCLFFEYKKLYTRIKSEYYQGLYGFLKLNCLRKKNSLKIYFSYFILKNESKIKKISENKINLLKF